MAVPPGCCDGPNETLIKILLVLNELTDSGGVGESVSIASIGGTAVSTGCGVSTAGTLRVAQATDCIVSVDGNVASDSVDSGDPVKIGAQGRTTLPTAVADGDRVNLIANAFGELSTVHALRAHRINQVTTITASTAETTILTAVAANFLDLYGLIVTNTSGTAVNVAIRDATAGTIRMNIAVLSNETRGFMLPACDGHKQAVVNNNWTATVSASVTSVIITTFAKQMP